LDTEGAGFADVRRSIDRDLSLLFELDVKDRKLIVNALRGPTAKLSASFRPHFANGPTLAPIRIRINDQPNCPIGSIATIGIGHMVA
jgi:hypothetical protein